MFPIGERPDRKFEVWQRWRSSTCGGNNRRAEQVVELAQLDVSSFYGAHQRPTSNVNGRSLVRAFSSDYAIEAQFSAVRPLQLTQTSIRGGSEADSSLALIACGKLGRVRRSRLVFDRKSLTVWKLRLSTRFGQAADDAVGGSSNVDFERHFHVATPSEVRAAIENGHPRR